MGATWIFEGLPFQRTKESQRSSPSQSQPPLLIEGIQSKLTQPDLTKAESIGDRLSLNYLELCHEELSSNNQYLNCTWKLTSSKHSSEAVASYGQYCLQYCILD